MCAVFSRRVVSLLSLADSLSRSQMEFSTLIFRPKDIRACVSVRRARESESAENSWEFVCVILSLSLSPCHHPHRWKMCVFFLHQKKKWERVLVWSVRMDTQERHEGRSTQSARRRKKIITQSTCDPLNFLVLLQLYTESDWNHEILVNFYTRNNKKERNKKKLFFPF